MAISPPGNNSQEKSLYKAPQGNTRSRVPGYMRDPEIEAILRKMIPDVDGTFTQTTSFNKNRVDVPDPTYLQQIAGTIGQSTTDATSLLQLLPDLSLVMNLLVSAILAPKDLTSTEITFKVDRHAFRLPIAGRMLDIIVDHFKNVYNIKRLCPDALKDIIFKTGSYPIVVIPENAVDAMINGTKGYSPENYASAVSAFITPSMDYKGLGFLGPGPSAVSSRHQRNPNVTVSAIESIANESLPTSATVSSYASSMGTFKASCESYLDSLQDKKYAVESREFFSAIMEGFDSTIFEKTVLITDNFNVLKTAALQEARKRGRVREKISLETGFAGYYGGGGGYDNYPLGGMQKPRNSFNNTAIVQAIQTNEMLVRPTVGHPLIMRIPSESVIPVFITPEKHLGYFVLLDTDGNPLRLANRRDIYNDLSTSNNGTASSTQGSSQMIQMTQNLSMGVNPRENPRDPAQMARIYGQLLENELKTRLSTGLYGNNPNMRLAMSGEVYEIMLARSLKRQQTQILYIPSELLIYMAFDYSENGTGRSVTEQSKIIGAMRAMLGFSNVMAGIKNSVSRQTVNLTLSDNDIDPSKTIARVIDEYTRRRNVTMPFVASDPADMIAYINMAGVEFNVEGKGTPSHKINIEDKQTNRAKVDIDLDNLLRDRHYMAYGLTPETVIASTGADFATTVVTNNQMFAKRVISYQDLFTPFLDQFVQTVTLNSGKLLNDLRDVVVNSVTDLTQGAAVQSTPGSTVDIGKNKGTSDVSVVAPELQSVTNEAASPALLTEYTTPVAKDKIITLTADERRNVDQIVYQFVNAVRVGLPRPDSATEEAQIKALDQHAELVDKTMPFWLDAAFLGESNLGEFSGHLEEAKAALRALLMRQWMSNNGILPELQEITALDEDGSSEVDLQQLMNDHIKGVAAFLLPYLKDIGAAREKIKAEAASLDKAFPDANLGGSGVGGVGNDKDAGDTDGALGGMGDEVGGTFEEGSGDNADGKKSKILDNILNEPSGEPHTRQEAREELRDIESGKEPEEPET